MSAEEQYGESTEWDLLVERIRQMPDETRDHEARMAEARAYDKGWRDCADSMITDLRQNKRNFGRRLESRIYREYRTWQRRFVFDTTVVIAVLAVTAAALLYLRGL